MSAPSFLEWWPIHVSRCPYPLAHSARDRAADPDVGCTLDQDCRSRITAIVSRICVSATAPTLPRVARTRTGDTERTCWHCASDRAARPCSEPGSMITSEPNALTVVVSGTTWTTDGETSRIRCAVTTIAGCWTRPPVLPAPRDRGRRRHRRSASSPDCSSALSGVASSWPMRSCRRLRTHRDRVSDSGTEIVGEPLQLLVCRHVNPALVLCMQISMQASEWPAPRRREVSIQLINSGWLRPSPLSAAYQSERDRRPTERVRRRHLVRADPSPTRAAP